MAQLRDCMEAFKIVVIYLKWINCHSYSAELPVQEKLLLVLNSGKNPRISKTLGQTIPSSPWYIYVSLLSFLLSSSPLLSSPLLSLPPSLSSPPFYSPAPFFLSYFFPPPLTLTLPPSLSP